MIPDNASIAQDITMVPLPACASPVTPVKAPSIDVPAGACDCHAHVFGEPRRYPYRENRRYTPAPATNVHAYGALLHSLSIKRAVLVQPTIYNDCTITLDGLTALKTFGIDARGVVLPDSIVAPEADDRALQALHESGVRGVRLHFRDGVERRMEQHALLRRYDSMLARIKALGWHVQIHLDARVLPSLRHWISSLDIDVVLDHFARVSLASGPEEASVQSLLGLLAEGRCWLKLSAPYRFGDAAPPYPALVDSVQRLIAAAPDRMVWGTDWPHSSFEGVMPSDADLLDSLAVWVPDHELRRRILAENPARLYGFSSEPA